jgi:hypothetical protein
MNLISQRLVAAGLLAAAFAPAAAQAASQRTFVSGSGLDANPCTLSAPCRTFAGALVNTSPGGEIYVLDTAGYGSVTINQAVSIVNQTSTAAATATGGGFAITINAAATDKIVLRGLTVVGAGSGSNGVVFNSGGSLSVEDCSVSDFTQAGIQFQPTAAAQLFVSNTRVANTPIAGINVVPQIPATNTATVQVQATINHVTGRNNGSSSFFFDGRDSGPNVKIQATVANSVGTDSFQGLASATSTGHASSTVMVRNTTLSNNNFGLNSFGPLSTVFVGHSTITGNDTALVNSGTLDSYGDNDINGNGTLGAVPSPVAFH